MYCVLPKPPIVHSILVTRFFLPVTSHPTGSAARSLSRASCGCRNTGWIAMSPGYAVHFRLHQSSPGCMTCRVSATTTTERAVSTLIRKGRAGDGA